MGINRANSPGIIPLSAALSVKPGKYGPKGFRKYPTASAIAPQRAPYTGPRRKPLKNKGTCPKLRRTTDIPPITMFPANRRVRIILVAMKSPERAIFLI